jgi:tetratricopeptide (TPR) repeat protein
MLIISGQLALLKGNVDTATAAFKASMEQDLRSHAAPLALGEYYLSLGFVDEAVSLWKEFLKTSPQNRTVRGRLKAVRVHTDTSKTSAKVQDSVQR